MKAALLEAPHKMKIIDVPRPEIKRPDEVVVEIKSVGVCGSEVHAFENTHPYRKAPVILGHEAAGVVVDVGVGVTRFSPGDRVYIDPQWTCGECEHCQNGNINLCHPKRVLGTKTWPGAFGKFVISPEESVFALADHLSFDQGAMIEPLTVGVHVARRAYVSPGDSVVILGSGSIGGMVSGVCSAMGAEKVVVADIRQHCMDAAIERLGATADILLPNPEAERKILDATGGGADAVFITADDPGLVNLGLKVLKKRGKLVLVALLNEEPLNFTGYEVISKEIELIGSLMANHSDVKFAEKLVMDGLVDVEGIVTHHLPIDEAQKGMEMAKDKTEEAIKVILKF